MRARCACDMRRPLALHPLINLLTEHLPKISFVFFVLRVDLAFIYSWTQQCLLSFPPRSRTVYFFYYSSGEMSPRSTIVFILFFCFFIMYILIGTSLGLCNVPINNNNQTTSSTLISELTCVLYMSYPLLVSLCNIFVRVSV